MGRICVPLLPSGALAFHESANFVYPAVHDDETQARPSRPRGKERLEDFIQLIVGDTASLIFNRKFDILRARLRARQTNPDHPSFSARFQGVYEEVGNDVACSLLSAFDQARPCAVHLQGDVAPLGFHP